MNRKNERLFFLPLALCLLASACIPTPTASGKPSILLAAPPHGAEFREGETVFVQSASGDAAGIARVELSVDGALVRSDSAPSPQTYFNIVQNWKATPGARTLAVRAYNTKGIASDAASVSISVLPALASASATPVAIAAPSPVLPPTPPPGTPVTSPTATCADNAELVTETIPEGTVLPPSQPFDKVWRMKNSGTCAWGVGYAFAFVNGEAMSNDTTIALIDPIAPGEPADLWIQMTAPSAPGTHRGQWQVRNGSGVSFGVVFKTAINVVAGAPPPAAAEPPAAQPGAPPQPTSRSLLPPWWFARTPTWTPDPRFGIVPTRPPTWTPHPGIGIVPSRTPTRR